MEQYYMQGLYFLITYFIICYVIGAGFTRKGKAQALIFVRGFVFLTAALYPVGVYVQLKGLEWAFYFKWFKLIILGMLALSVALILIRSIYHKKFDILFPLKHVRDYWLLYIVVIFLTVVSVSNVAQMWFSNCHDDAYYLLRIANYPYSDAASYLNPTTGLVDDISLSARVINTYELEASCWMVLFNIPVTIFVRVFYVFRNFYIFGMSILAFAHSLNDGFFTKKRRKESSVFNKPKDGKYYVKKKDDEENPIVEQENEDAPLWKRLLSKKAMKPWFIQLTVLIMPIFVFWQWWYGDGLFYVYDFWKYQTAMWYGSSLVMSIPILVGFSSFLDRDYSFFELFIYWAAFSMCFVSQASQAFPIILIMSFAIAIVYFLQRLKPIPMLLGLGVAASIYFIGIYLGDKYGFNSLLANEIPKQMGNEVFIGCLCAMAVSTIFSNRYVRIWNALIVMMLVLMCVPGLNHIFLYGTQGYYFVAYRGLSLMCVTVVVSAFVEVFFLLYRYLHIWLIPSVYAIAVGAFIVNSGFSSYTSFYGTNPVSTDGGMVFEYETSEGYDTLTYFKQVLDENPYLMPQTLYDMSVYLEDLALSRDDDLLVVAPLENYFDGYKVFTSYFLRTYAPHVTTLNSLFGFSDTASDTIYKMYDIHDLGIWIGFNQWPDDYQYLFKELLEYYDIDCFIVYNENNIYDEVAHTFGFSLANTFTTNVLGDEEGIDNMKDADVNFYIYVRN